MISGIVTAILIVTFCGICVWAWSGRRQPTFDAAARMALEEDAVAHANDKRQSP